jgi:hypothetical protein
MKVAGEYVLVQQTDTKKKSFVILPGKNEKDGYTTTFEIKEIGPMVPEAHGLEVGKAPIFQNHVTFNGMNVTSPKDQKDPITALTIVHYLDIIGLE